MEIDKILQHYTLDEDQKAVISHEHGPLRVIAGPGSGKTLSLVLLAMNLLLQEKAKPDQLILCTYTEKAAFEMQDRLREVAKEVAYEGNLSLVRVGTIHSICAQLIESRVHEAAMPLGNGYETLDQFSQRLLIFEHLQEICTAPALAFFLEKWATHWEIVKQLQFLFDKIAEELIFEKLKQYVAPLRGTYGISPQDMFLIHLKHAYHTYQNILGRTHCIDFAHQQKLAYNILSDPERATSILQDVRYVLVDEYQDTNYIQEQILLALSSATGNLCVVGDEDQAIYRFRGATARNLLKFENVYPDCKTVHLRTNYRSHATIIEMGNRCMSSTKWVSVTGEQLRTHRTDVVPARHEQEPYPAVLSVLETSPEEEAEQLAELISTLKERGIITDYSHVALLLRSVKPYMSGVYIRALEQKDISTFCPRARVFFEQDEVRLMLGCLTFLFGYVEENMPSIVGNEAIGTYLRECQQYMERKCEQFPALAKKLVMLEAEITREQEDAKQKSLIHYFYQLLTTEPFMTIFTHEEHMHNLMLFSRLLNTFRTRYLALQNAPVEHVQRMFFNIFLRLLYEEGVNQHEDQQQNFPAGHVPILTIHQAKGLEFPVVIVGRLDQQITESEQQDKALRQFYHYVSPEPEPSVPRFDLMRHYYVAFSRAQDLLVLSAAKRPNKYVAPLLRDVPQWAYIREELRMGLHFDARKRIPLKSRFSFTTHIRMYETCPRRYQYFRAFNFAPSRSGDFFLGQLVHQTIENIHRTARDGHYETLNEETIRRMFEKVAVCLEQKYHRFEDDGTKDKALGQVMNYFRQNRREIRNVKDAEVTLSVEKDRYILTGKVDLLVRINEKLHLFDFKTEHRPADTAEHLAFYERQLRTYAHVIGQHQELPERLFIYWTGETQKEDAVMEIRYRPEDAERAGQYFDETVAQIANQQFPATPGPHICTSCDLRNLCVSEGLLEQVDMMPLRSSYIDM